MTQSLETWLSIIAALAVGGTLIWSLTGSLSLLCRRGSAALRHRLWGLSCAAVLIAPLAALTVPLPRSLVWPVPLLKVAVTAPAVELSAVEMPEPHFTEMALDAGPEHGPPMFVDIGELSESAPQTDYVPVAFEDAVSPASSAPPRDWGPSLTAVLIGLWCAGLLVALAHSVLARRRITGLLRRSLAVTHEPVLQLARDLTQRLGLRRPVRVLTSAETAVPFVTGVACPALVLPTGFGAWPAERLPVVLVHELMHVKRGDVAWQSLAQMCLAATWFHPLAWLALWRLRVEREHACDDAVLLAGYRPSDYASQLVEVASDLRRGTLRFAPAVAMASRSPIERRVRAILDATLQRGPAGRWRTAATLAGLSAMLLVVAAVTPGRSASAVEEPQAEVNQEPVAADEKGKGEPPAEAAAEDDEASRRVVQILNEKVDVKVDDMPLTDVLSDLARRHRIPIRLELLSFVQRGVRLDKPISFNASGTTLRSALHLIVGTQHEPSIEPTIVVRHGVLVISLGEDVAAWVVRAKSPEVLRPYQLRGTVRGADGNPVPDASIEVRSWCDVCFATADVRGEFEIPGQFAIQDITLIAKCTDGSLQAASPLIPAQYEFKPVDPEPMTLVLQPAKELTVQVTPQTAGAHVAFMAHPNLLAMRQTGLDGSVRFKIPEGLHVSLVAAYQSGEGLDYKSFPAPKQLGETSRVRQPANGETIPLKLEGARTARMRFVDENAEPVGALRVHPTQFRKPGEAEALSSTVLLPLGTRLTTAANGEVTFDWLPAWDDAPTTFEVSIPDRLRDRVVFDPQKVVDGVLTTVLRREVEVRGRVRDAAGMAAAEAEVLAAGAGYLSDRAMWQATADKDGKFVLRLPPEQVYLLTAISRDGQKIGSIDRLVVRTGKPQDGLTILLKPGTRVFGRVTEGEKRVPVASAEIRLSWTGRGPRDLADVELLNPDGSNRALVPVQWRSVTTDADGKFEVFLGPGRYDLRFSRGRSHLETRRIVVADAKEQEVNFDSVVPEHGVLRGRVVTGDPPVAVAGAIIGGVVLSPSRRSWLTAMADDRGEFSVNRELAPIVLHAETPDGKLAGFRRIDADDSRATIKLAPTASCRFRILDGPRPLPPGCEVAYGIRIENDDSRGQLEERDFGGTVQTDKDGRVTLPSLVVGAEYEVRLVRLAGSRTAFLDHHFVDIFADKPGLHDRGDVELKNLGSVRHTPEQVAKKLQQFVDDPLTAIERHSAVMKVVPLTNRRVLTRFVNPDSVWFSPQSTQEWPQDPIWQDYPGQIVPLIPTRREEAKTLARQLGVSLPSDGTPLLVIQDENGKVMGQLTGPQLLSVDGQRHNRDAVLQFLRKHAPEHRHARELLVEALKQAKAVNKQVFVQETSGWPDSSVALRRFLHQHRSILSKDYVVVLLDHRSEQGAQVAQEIRKGLYWGNPWLAILDADGKVLTTSNDAKGYYIGFPSKSEPDGIEHFLKMLRSTSQQMTEDDFQTLQRALEGTE